MKCQCGEEISVTAKFCQSCGTKVEAVDAKRPGEVTLDWLIAILAKQGYAISDRNNELTFIAKHKDRCNLYVEMKANVGFIGIQTSWQGKKAGWGKRGELHAALNKANSSSWVGIYHVADDGDTLSVSSHIALTEQISERDIVSFVDLFEKVQRQTLSSSGLIALLT